MSQADRDAEKWMQDNARWQKQALYRAKETGDAYFIDEFGTVQIEKAKEGEKE